MDIIPHFTMGDWGVWFATLLIIALAWWVEGEG